MAGARGSLPVARRSHGRRDRRSASRVFVRELLPQDLKFELDALADDEAIAIGHYLGSVVALAHARQLEPGDCAAWLAEFRKENAKHLEAPAWLWAAVVDLVALHEGAYLEHCREHALERRRPPSPAARVRHRLAPRDGRLREHPIAISANISSR